MNCVRSGEGRRVVFVHGVGASLESWDGVVSCLGEGFRTLRYDLRGHGNSEKTPGPYSLDMFVDDLRDVVAEHGWTSFHLVGFSLGGLIAQGFVLRYPQKVRSLTIVSSVAGRTPEERERVLERARTLLTSGAGVHTASSVERWFTEEFRAAHPEVVQQRVQRSMRNDPASYAAAYQVLAECDLLDRLHEVEVPALVMTGENDTGSTARMASAMASRIRNSRLHILPRLKHSVLLEAPDQVAAQLRPFIEEMDERFKTADEMFQRGLAVRRAVLGDEYVDRAMGNIDDFNCGFQRMVTTYCWGECWGDDTLTPRERSLLNLGMIAALGKMHEFELHLRGAMRNGIDEDELAAVIKQIAVYCGVPVGVDCMRAANAVRKNSR